MEELVYEISAMLMSHHMVDRRERPRRSIADLSYDEIAMYGLQDDLEDYRLEESHELELQIRDALEDEYVEDE
ncbi:hypothetical protein FBQ95_05225 [Chloroflexi bacterium CFX3]|nr:hypothetical protein [Chloroflexi bacterium CFX3]